MRRPTLRRAALLGALGSAIARAAPAQAAATDSLVVQTGAGAIRGFRADRVNAFLGIRYAAPPVGALRWRPPQPAAHRAGTQPATTFGNTCPATASTNGPRSETEDCLFVNVWRPQGLNRHERRPVYVFIHGGGLLNGSSNQADMTEIVQRTGVIGVSFNYRLGAFGFLATRGLSAEQGNSGNYGVMDQQAALQWVRDNTAAFGGRPGQVTVGGESAGGWSVCTQLVAPASAGLFSQAMIQSGACPSRTLPEAEAAGNSVAAAVGCTAPAIQVACLRATPAGSLLDAFGPVPGPPVRGTAFLPQDPRQAIAAGNFARVPVVIGANLDEGRTFAQGFIGSTQAQYLAWLQQTFRAGADTVLQRYPWPANSDQFTAAYLIGAIQTDAGLLAGIGGCPNRQLTHDLASHTRTYAYEFANRTGPGLTPIPGYVWGAGHAVEVAYLFPSFNNGPSITARFDQGDQRLAVEMKQYWGAFVRIGTPSVRRQTPWPPYDRTQLMLQLRPAGRSTIIRDRLLSAEHQCDFWDALTAPR